MPDNILMKPVRKNPYVSAHNTYNSIEVSDASPVELIIKLYDGAINFLSKAILEIQQNRQSEFDYIKKTTAIIEELLSALNVEVGGEVARNLKDLYLYMLMELSKAKANRDATALVHVQNLLKTLMSGWKEVKDQGISGVSRKVAVAG